MRYKQYIVFFTSVVLLGCSNKLSDEARQNSLCFSEEMDSYISQMHNNPSAAKSLFEPVYTHWLNIKGSIPSCSQKTRIENALNLHRLALVNTSVFSLYTETSEGMELPDDQLQQWKEDCGDIQRLIDKKYLKELCRNAEKNDQSADVVKMLGELVSSPVAFCPPDRMFGRPQPISVIVQMNLEECTNALDELIPSPR